MNGSEPNKLKPALIAGIASGAASSIPGLSCINVCCCALVIGGGFLAAFLYLKDSHVTPEPAYGDGAIVGLLAGVFAAVTATLISIPFRIALSALGMGGGAQLQEVFENAGTDIPPQLMGLLEMVTGAGGITFMGTIFSFATNLVLFSIFSLIGGIIGMAVLHGKVGEQQNAPSSYMPPPPPAA